MAITQQCPTNCSSQRKGDVWSSKKIYPKDLNIVWGEDSRYWNVPKDGSPAELKQVCWLEVTCSVQNTKLDKEYSVGFSIHLAPDASGWKDSPVYILAKRGKKGKLESKGWFDFETVPKGVNRIMRVKVGKSEKPCETSEDSELRFVMYEVKGGKWKGGLKINHAFIEEVA